MAKKINTKKNGTIAILKKNIRGIKSNNILIVLVVLFLITGGYFYGKYQQLEKNMEALQRTPTNNVVVSPSPTQTPEPTLQPVKQKTTNTVKTTPVATAVPERKKVSIYIDDDGGLTKGQFYCYEDKVNYLADLQNEIRVKQTSVDGCNSLAGAEGSECTTEKCNSLVTDFTQDAQIKAFNECSQKCYNDASAKCNNAELGDLRRKLYSEVHQYCP